MVLKNFRTLFLLGTTATSFNRNVVYETGHWIYYKDMRGNIQDPSTDGNQQPYTTRLDAPWFGNPYFFMYPAVCQTRNVDSLVQIKDYDNLEDMIKSTDFWSKGHRYSQRFTDPSTSGMIIIGSGDTPPTPDDYCLDSWIPTTDLSVQSFDCFFFPVNNINNTPEENLNEKIGAFQATYKNVSNENQTVKEVGIMKDIYDNAVKNGYSTQRTKALVVRSVLDNPVTIKPNELYTFTVTLS